MGGIKKGDGVGHMEFCVDDRSLAETGRPQDGLGVVTRKVNGRGAGVSHHEPGVFGKFAGPLDCVLDIDDGQVPLHKAPCQPLPCRWQGTIIWRRD